MSNGRRWWAIPEGYIPGWSHGPEPAMTSHDTICVLNTGDDAATLRLTIYFEDRDPVGPYLIDVPARRTRHVRLNDLHDPTPIPVETAFATAIESNVPVIIQYTRLDSRQAENALLSTIAYAER
jgi:hypothetical protein